MDTQYSSFRDSITIIIIGIVTGVKGFYFPFNSQGQIGTGRQNCLLYEWNHKGDSL